MSLENKIEIEWTSDTYDDCETCGTTWAEGATVKLNDEIILNLIPEAACYDGDSWSESEVYKKILEKLGYKVTEL